MDVQLILIEDHPKLGKRGDCVKVATGFAYNFLIPQGKAKLATQSNLGTLKEEQARVAKRKAENEARSKQNAQKIEGISLTLEVAVGEGDKLYGAVTSQDIQQALVGKGVSVDKREIQLEEPIKKLGAYQVVVKLHPQVTATLKFSVVKKK